MVAVAIARLGESAEVSRARDGGGFVGTGRALSAVAGRLSYVHGLKVGRKHCRGRLIVLATRHSSAVLAC